MHISEEAIAAFKATYKNLHERSIHIRRLLQELHPPFRDGAIITIQCSGVNFHPFSMEYDEDIFIDMEVLAKDDGELRTYIENLLEERKQQKEDKDEEEAAERALYERLKRKYG